MRFQPKSWMPFSLTILTLISAGDEARCQVPRGRFTNVLNLGPNVNIEGSTESAVDTLQAISGDGLTLYFTSFRDNGYGSADLWQATRPAVNEPFGPAMNLGPEINGSALDNFPGISFDDLTLYFASTRPGGEGNLDLYQATRPSVDDAFGNVMNLGPGVNTEFIERGPHVAPDGLTLYFTSNRPDGEGGDDIYVATRGSLDEPFANVTNLGTGINAPTGEFVPSVSSNGLIMFFSDFFRPPFRPGGRGDSDIWVAVRETTDAQFGDVLNLNNFSAGSDVNTEHRENAPLISRDWPAAGSQLYFSSNSNGGLDIWQATWFPETRGDFNGDGLLDVVDVDALTAEVLARTDRPQFDLNDDGIVDQGDRIIWITDIKNTFVGDTNLDGRVNSADLNTLALSWRSTDATSWSHGDFNGDGNVNASDLNDLALNWRSGVVAATSAPAVPEPSSFMQLLLGVFAFVRRIHRGT